MSPSRLYRRLQAWVATPGFQKYLANTGWPFFFKILSLGVSFFISLMTARYLGPVNYGQLSYAISFVGIFSFIANLGIEQILYRDLIKYPDKRDVYLGTAMDLRLMAGAFAGLLSIGLGYALNPNDLSGTLIAMLSLGFLFNATLVIVSEFQARVKSAYPAAIGFIVATTLSLLKLAAIFFHKGILYFASIFLLESILYASFFLVWRYIKYGSIRRWSFDTSIAKHMLRESWPLMFSSAFALIYGRIDQVFIKHGLNNEAVGVYDAAVRLAEVWLFVPSMIVSSLFPAIVHALHHTQAEYHLRLGRLIFLLIGFSLCASATITALAPWIMHLAYGSAFLAGTIILQIYVWSGISSTLSQVTNAFLVAEHKSNIIFVSSCVSMTSNVILNLLFIPRYGIVGSAWATFISYALAPLTVCLYPSARKTLAESINVAIRNLL